MNRRPYIRPVSRISWYMKNVRYKRYIAREITCFLIGAYTVLFTIGLWRLSDGREAFDIFMATMWTSGGLTFNCIAFVFALYHSVTWFNVTPQAIPLMKGDDFVPGSVIVRAHYTAWVIISLVILIMVGVYN